MDIQHQQKTTGEFFIVNEQQEKVADILYYMKDENTMVIEHTNVDKSLAGQGIGKKLVAAGVEFAREHHLKIIPECPYAKSVFEKTPEYADVWEK
ncbi:MAG: GNAT family N-acetyltransferase [Chitinophagales bacterium]